MWEGMDLGRSAKFGFGPSKAVSEESVPRKGVSGLSRFLATMTPLFTMNSPAFFSRKLGGFLRLRDLFRLLPATCLWTGVMLWGSLTPGGAQVMKTNLSEGFESSFPGSWSVGDANASGTPAYWDQVDSSFGGEGTHSGSYKGYCAGIGYAGTTNAPQYVTNMTAYMSRSINLSGATNAQVTFWQKIPGIEATYDWAWVFVDSTAIWSNTANIASWTQATFSLNPFVGGTHTLKFQFVSDYLVNYEGWYLDDILVTSLYPPVANDYFTNATVISGSSGTTSGTTYAATKETGEPNHAGYAGGASVWFRWTAPSSGTVTFNTFGSSFDTLLGVYTGTDVGTLSWVASNDQTPGSDQSSVTFNATAGTTYRIAVDGWNNQVGNYTLNWVYPTVNEAILSSSVTNYTLYVVDSDASNADPAYNRESIMVKSAVASTNLSSTAHYSTYVFTYRLVNTNNQAHPLYDSTGFTNASYTCSVTNTFWLAGLQNLTNTLSTALRPAARLNPYQQYFVELKLYRLGVFTGDVTNQAPLTYLHFTNQISGDAAFNVIPYDFAPSFSQSYAVQTVAGKKAFLLDASFWLFRYDGFTNASPTTNNVTITLNYELHNAANGALVPLRLSSSNFVHAVPSYTVGTPNAPALIGASDTVILEPVSQLDSVSNTYYAVVNLSCDNGPGQSAVTGNPTTSTANRLLHFNGSLYFGGIQTTFTNLANNPPVVGLEPTDVLTQVAVSGNSGVVTGSPTHNYGDGTALSVRLYANGNAYLQSGSVTLNGPAPDNDVISKVRFLRSPVTLDVSGASGDIVAILPAGFGYRTNNIASKIIYARMSFPAVPLNGNLAPLDSTLTFAPGGPVYFCEESKPVWIQGVSIDWQPSSGKFQVPAGLSPIYVRAAEYAALEGASNQLVNPPSMALKRSNERYFNFLTGIPGVVQVNPDVNSNALMSVVFDFGPGNFVTHFPYNIPLAWSGAGEMVDYYDLAYPGSTLNGAGTVRVPYSGDCPGCNPAGVTNIPAMNPAGGTLYFTVDGGLVAAGATVGAVDLKWGYIPDLGNYAQRALGFTNATFHMPGLFLVGSLNTLADNLGPVNILYTGVAATNLWLVERPMTTAYQNGFADYAGLNFRCLADNAHAGRSTIAGQPNINWQLTGRSKYYVRSAGVTGIHESVDGSFPASLTLYGYGFTFNDYGLSYLDSLNQVSLTKGSLKVPFPSDIVQNFEELKFDCLGGLTKATVPASDGFKVLNYWQADFKALAIQFKRNDGCDCGEGSLVMGVEAYASHVDKALYGLLGFQPNGNLIPRSFGLVGVDSRLKAPTSFTLKGPTNTLYNFMPVADAYYNSYSNSPPSPGWINLVGKMDVPFFEDMKTHLQTSCRTNIPGVRPPIYLAGGWARTGSGNPNHGWQVGGVDFFTTSYFDPDNFGFPAGVSLSTYRDNSSGEDYHPRAQKLWLNVVDFDYPLSWSTITRTFKSYQPITKDLLLLTVQHQLTYMDPKYASLDFGVQYDGLPKISIANLAFNAVDEATGVAHSIVEAASEPIHSALTTGLNRFDQMLNAQMRDLFDGVFDATVDPIIANFYRKLSNDWSGMSLAQRRAFMTNVVQQANNYFVGSASVGTSNLSYVLQNLGDASSSANNLIGQLQTSLRDVTNAISAVTDGIGSTNGVNLGGFVSGLLHKAGDSYDIAPHLVGSLVGDFAGQFVNAIAQPELDNQIRKVQPALEQIGTILNDTKSTLGVVASNLDNVGDFAREIDDKLRGLKSELTNVSLGVTTEVSNYFGRLDFSVDNPFQVLTEQEIKTYIRQQVEDAFFASTPAAEVQTIIRQRLYDLDSQMRESIDSVFQQLNTVMRDMISQSLAGVDDSINGLLGEVGNVIGAGKINGHALIKGDSLSLLRLDGHFEWKAPDAMQFDAYLQIKELNSDGSSGCYSAHTPATEVTLGAQNVDFSWISPDLKANIETKFTFDSGTPYPVNLAGTLELNGELSYEAFKLYNLAASLAFGKYENYLALRGGIKFNSYDFSGGIFFGRTCSLDPIKLLDPDVAAMLGNPPFTGAYCYGQGWIPVSEAILGIPASCMFRISAGVGAGAFFFLEGPTYGGKMFLGVSGEALCIVSIEGDITMIGVKHGDDLQFKGHGHFEADIGSCPFCISFSKSISLQYKNKSWHFD